MYAADNHENLPWNMDAYQDDTTTPNWVAGVCAWDVEDDVTNLAWLTLATNSSISAYLSRAVGAYHCPEDTFLSPVQIAAGWTQRPRSVSMNYWLGDGFAGDDFGAVRQMKSGIPGAFIVRLTEFLTLSPTMAFVFLDEHPDSDINPAFWQGRVTRPTPGQALPANRQLPASYHSGGCTFSFADGHQEYKKWLVHQTIQPVTCTYWPWYGKATSATSDLRDWNWLVLHSIP